MLGLIRSKGAGGATPTRARRAYSAAIQLIAGISFMVNAEPVPAENWHVSASATATETYTNNVNYSPSDLAKGDFVTSLSGAVQINGSSGGARLKLNGSIGLGGTVYLGQGQNNSFAPQANLSATLEAIEKFAFVDAQATVSQSFISPFGPQPADLVNATQNRYTQQTYQVSPYIKGVLGSSNVSYNVRDDNYWTVASSYGNSSPNIPSTYTNNLTASMASPANPWGWTLSFNRSYYDNGIANDPRTANSTTYNNFLGTLDYQVDPQLQLSLRGGYQSYSFAPTSLDAVRYGIGVQWSPTDRTHVSGFLDHEFFGTGYSLEVSHRLPNAALAANFFRGISSFPQLALAIPAGATVAQFLDAAFTTRIPDPAARAVAVSQFLANSGLPPTLASPVSFYATTLTLQQTATVSLVLIGVRNSLSFAVFNTQSEAISGSGSVLPPALQFGQNNTQTGGSIAFSHSLTGFTSLTASVAYSASSADTGAAALASNRSKNGNATLTLGTRFGPKTTGSASVSYSHTSSPGDVGTSLGTTSALNVFASVTHNF